MTHLLDEDRLHVTTAAREVFRVAPETAWRWALKGVGGVRLESIKVGGVRFTSRQACTRFLDKLNGAPSPRTEPAQTPKNSRRADAARKLDAAGI